MQDFLSIIWDAIETICVLYTFITIFWIVIPSYWRERLRIIYRRLFKKFRFIDEESVIGKLILDEIKIQDSGIDFDQEIRFIIDKHPVNVPNDFKEIAKRLERENDERRLEGKSPIFADLKPYAVHSILPHREGDNERPVCDIVLRESSYFYSLISIMAMNEKMEDKTIREKYYKELITDPWDNPTPQGWDIVHGFGMNTLVLTKDHSFVFSLRNQNTVSTGQGCLHLSVGEHLNKDVLDLNKDRKPDAEEVILKGLHQELGINEKKDNINIRFYGIAFAKSVCQYGVLGFTHLHNYSDEAIKSSWEISKDGHYENKDIIFINANIESIVQFLNTHPKASMTKFSLLNVCIALMNESILGRVSPKHIEKELKKLRLGALK